MKTPGRNDYKNEKKRLRLSRLNTKIEKFWKEQRQPSCVIFGSSFVTLIYKRKQTENGVVIV